MSANGSGEYILWITAALPLALLQHLSCNRSQHWGLKGKTSAVSRPSSNHSRMKGGNQSLDDWQIEEPFVWPMMHIAERLPNNVMLFLPPLKLNSSRQRIFNSNSIQLQMSTVVINNIGKSEGRDWDAETEERPKNGEEHSQFIIITCC